MRLIDADALKEQANDTDYMPTSEWVSVDDLECQPTIDAVPVVRCKDCKFLAEPLFEEAIICRKHLVKGNGEWFCADGERSEE